MLLKYAAGSSIGSGGLGRDTSGIIAAFGVEESGARPPFVDVVVCSDTLDLLESTETESPLTDGLELFFRENKPIFQISRGLSFDMMRNSGDDDEYEAQRMVDGFRGRNPGIDH